MKQKILILMFLSSLVTACGQSGSHAVTIPEPELYRLQPGELVLAASERDIPSIQADEDYFVQVEKADLEDEDLVVGLFIGGKSRAYPVRLLSLHEVVNDRVGEISVAVTWCPLCFSAVVFDRAVGGQELSFRASGYLLNDNLILIDHPTDTLWSQLLGQGIKGALRGTVLEVIPSSLTTWEVWRTNFPDTMVLSSGRLGYTGVLPDPYAGYFNSGAAGFGSAGKIDSRLPAKTLVVGVALGDDIKAYPLDTIREDKIIRDELGVYDLSIVWDEGLKISRIFLGNPGNEISIESSFNKEFLVEVPAQLVYWFAWTAFYPGSDIY